jgi:ubiquinone/menaquinone biosynthesis C-methylase UbiE
MNLEDLRQKEREKYESIYLDKDQYYRKRNEARGYGRNNHGKYKFPYVLNLKPTSVLDIGCGFGNFCNDLQTSGIENVYGMDIASVKTGNVINNPKIQFIDGESHHIPFEDSTIDIITSFDCLEHCLENDIDVIFTEMNRVVKNRCVFSIAYRQSGEDTQGVILHMTVKPKSWWIEKLNKLFVVEKSDNYLICIKR